MSGSNSPVPTGPQYPGAGARVGLRRGRSDDDYALTFLDAVPFDKDVATVLGRALGLWIAGLAHPSPPHLDGNCWVRESRKGFLKLDIFGTSILCGASVDSAYRDKILRGVINMRAMSETSDTQGFKFIPILFAGENRNVAYYMESLQLPQVISPRLVEDSLAFCHFLIFREGGRLGIDDPNAYLAGLCEGIDPRGVLSLEPFLSRQIGNAAEAQRSSFIVQIGEALQRSSSARAASKAQGKANWWSRLFRRGL